MAARSTASLFVLLFALGAFAGTGTGTIVIVAEAHLSGGALRFTSTLEPGEFFLAHGMSRVFSSVAPGTYTVVEFNPEELGFTPADVSCDDDDSSVDFRRPLAIINVDAGETVTCRFSNIRWRGLGINVPAPVFSGFPLSGDQLEPPVVTPERGGCVAAHDGGFTTFVCSHTVDQPTRIQVYRRAPGTSGEMVADLGDPASPVIVTVPGLHPTVVFTGVYYVDIASASRPRGAIRGRVLFNKPTVGPFPFTMDSSQVVPPVPPSGYTGSCTAWAQWPGASVRCTHDVPGRVPAHLHYGRRGQTGQVLSSETDTDGSIHLGVGFLRHFADFLAGLLYVDVHGAGVEIRGQIAPPLPAPGTIRIVKSTVPGGGSGFTFTDDVPGSPGTFTLDDGEVRTFADVAVGTYTISENASPAHSLLGISCDDGDSSGDSLARTATVNLQAGEVVTCTFTNLDNAAASQNVPAASEWAMLLMTLALGTVAWWRMR